MAVKKTKSLITLGKKIQKLRKQKELTQEKMAENLGISRVYMGYIEQTISKWCIISKRGTILWVLKSN